MNEEQRAIYMRAQILSAEIELQAMMIANKRSELRDEGITYYEGDFMELQGKYLLTHNQCITELVGS